MYREFELFAVYSQYLTYNKFQCSLGRVMNLIIWPMWWAYRWYPNECTPWYIIVISKSYARAVFKPKPT